MIQCTVKVQVFIICCFGVFVCCFLLTRSSPRRWTARKKLNISQNEDLQPALFEKQSQQPAVHMTVPHVASNVTYLTNLLKERLALPNDALRINYRSLCKDHKDDVEPCVQEGCPTLADRPLQERIEDLVLSPQFHLGDDQLKAVLRVVSNVRGADVIISSASSANHYREMQAMFQNLHDTVYQGLRNFTVVLFDLGLKKRQRRMTEKFCNCQVVDFPFHLFPSHVSDLHCYSWKAVIIRALISKAGNLLVWQDTTIRWTKNFPAIFERAMRFGQQFLENKHSARITANTIPQMFSYMEEEVCLYHTYHEIQCGLQVMKNDPLVIQAVLNPWTKCALEESCMCPVNPDQVIKCKRNSDKTLHRCHRFDQSAMSILLSKLYAADRYRIIMPEFSKTRPIYVQVNRRDKSGDYFSN